jgi:hypothetical protein
LVRRETPFPDFVNWLPHETEGSPATPATARQQRPHRLAQQLDSSALIVSLNNSTAALPSPRTRARQQRHHRLAQQLDRSAPIFWHDRSAPTVSHDSSTVRPTTNLTGVPSAELISKYISQVRLVARNSGLFYLSATHQSLRLMKTLAARVAAENVWDQSAYNQEIFRLAHGESGAPGVSVRAGSGDR